MHTDSTNQDKLKSKFICRRYLVQMLNKLNNHLGNKKREVLKDYKRKINWFE